MKKIIFILGLIILLAAIPITIYLVMKNQEIRSKAAPATTLSLKPSNSAKKVNDTFNLDVSIDTGENEVYVAEIYISYDPTKLEAESIINGDLFPSVLKPGVIDPSGKVTITIGTNDANNPVKGIGTLATVKFKAIASTTTAVTISFTADTFIGADPTKEPSVNVLIGTSPAKVTISSSESTASLTSANSLTGNTTSPTVNPTRSTSPTPSPTSTPSANSQNTTTEITITSPQNGEITTSTPTFRGVAPANSEITLTIYSSPRSAVVTANSTGNWSYTVSEPLTSGPHDLVVTAQNPTTGSSSTANVSFVSQSPGSEASDSATPIAGSFSTTLLLILVSSLLILSGFLLVGASAGYTL